MGIDLIGARRHVRDAAAGEARRRGAGERGEVREREKAAVALAERNPAGAAELGEAQVLKVADDRVREEALEEAGLRGGVALACNRGAVHARGASGATLVGQDNAEVAHRLRDPAVACRRGETRTGAAGTALQVDKVREVAPHVLRRADHAVEEAQGATLEDGVALLGRRGVRERRGRGAPDARKAGRRSAPPVERDVDRVILNGEAGQVVAC